jgi:hypothetical protein
MNEVNRHLRGHGFLPAWEELTAIPRLQATEHVPLAEKVIHLHFFIGACDWYVAELDDETWEAFGYANLGDRRTRSGGTSRCPSWRRSWSGRVWWSSGTSTGPLSPSRR